MQSGEKQLLIRARSRFSVLRRSFCRADGSQIVEFAVSLRLLLVIVVGITDFGSAFGLKQTLNNAAREGARFGANQTMLDVTNATSTSETGNPISVSAIRDVVDNYLVAANIIDCGLGSATFIKTNLVWTYTTSTNCDGGTLTLVVDRGSTQRTGGGSPVTVEMTHVNIQYPYQWTFGRLISFFVPTATYAQGTTTISGDATMTNLN